MLLLIADLRQPFVLAGVNITAFAGFQIIVTLCIQIVPSSEQ